MTTSTGTTAGNGWGAAVLLGQGVLSRPELPELLDRTLARIRAASIDSIAVLVIAPTPAIEAVAVRHRARFLTTLEGCCGKAVCSCSRRRMAGRSSAGW